MANPTASIGNVDEMLAKKDPAAAIKHHIQTRETRDTQMTFPLVGASDRNRELTLNLYFMFLVRGPQQTLCTFDRFSEIGNEVCYYHGRFATPLIPLMMHRWGCSSRGSVLLFLVYFSFISLQSRVWCQLWARRQRNGASGAGMQARNII